MKLLSRILLVTCLSVALIRQVDRSNSKSRFNQHQTWNTKRFPVWKDGDPRYKNSWTASDMEVMMEEDYIESQTHVSIIKRQAPDTNDCVIYRYGSFSTEIEIIEGIESVQIVQVTVADDFLLTQMVSCQGSLPTEVCTVVSDADCHVPVTTICIAVSPSSDCQLILRHFFNDSGIFCINVSMMNDVSLAVTNARVNINIAGSRLTSASAAALLLGILTVVSAMGAVVFAYKHLKGYQRLTEDLATCQSKDTSVSSMPVPFWSLMNQQRVDQKKEWCEFC